MNMVVSSLLMFAEPYTFVINRDKFRTACDTSKDRKS